MRLYTSLCCTETCPQGLLDLLEMVLAKADPRVTTMYDRKLAEQRLWAMGDELRGRFLDTKQVRYRPIFNPVLLLRGRFQDRK